MVVVVVVVVGGEWVVRGAWWRWVAVVGDDGGESDTYFSFWTLKQIVVHSKSPIYTTQKIPGTYIIRVNPCYY